LALTLRGITYDAGTEFVPGAPSRRHWQIDDVRRDLRVIRDELGCNSVSFYGTMLTRILEAARLALDLGLHVVLQLRSVDVDKAGSMARICEAARGAAAMNAPHGRLVLNLGCEITLFTHGFLPGRDFRRRIDNLRWSWPWLLAANPMLTAFLRRAVAAVRSDFSGPLTYSSGSWETPDWRPFDFVGVDLYRERGNEANYPQVLRRYFAPRKPVIVTEFGCCAYEGAESLGGSGWMAVDYGTEPPSVKPEHVRSERVQAETIGSLIDLFEAEGVHDAYLYDFLQTENLHHADPGKDLDMAGYGIVKPVARPDGGVTWEPKLAFHAVAERYRRAS
jgi:hypothetical protein